jgi:hypothetical protein
MLLLVSLATSFGRSATTETAKSSTTESSSENENETETVEEQERAAENVAKVTTKAKFMSNAVNPLDDPKVLDASSKMLFSTIDSNKDGKIFGNEIPANMKGFDINDDSEISMDELKSYLKESPNRA